MLLLPIPPCWELADGCRLRVWDYAMTQWTPVIRNFVATSCDGIASAAALSTSEITTSSPHRPRPPSTRLTTACHMALSGAVIAYYSSSFDSELPPVAWLLWHRWGQPISRRLEGIPHPRHHRSYFGICQCQHVPRGPAQCVTAVLPAAAALKARSSSSSIICSVSTHAPQRRSEVVEVAEVSQRWVVREHKGTIHSYLFHCGKLGSIL